MEGTGLLLCFRMILMRLEEERVGNVFMMISFVCMSIAGRIWMYGQCGLYVNV